MRWVFWTLGAVTAFSMAGCERRGNESGAARGAGFDTMPRMDRETTLQGRYDTGMRSDTGWRTPDTGRGVRRGSRDSARGNQTESGVTNTETGKSRLGRGVTKTRPDQDQPVTSKGDTLRKSNDTTNR